MVNFWLLSLGVSTSSCRDDKRYGDGSPSFNAGSFVVNSYVSDARWRQENGHFYDCYP